MALLGAGGVGGGGVGATCKSLMNAGFSLNRRCRGPGRREVSVLGLTAAEVSGAAERPTEVSGDGPAADVGAILIGTGRVTEAEAPTWGELDGGTATVGASGGEGGVGLLSRAWGTIG